MHRQIDAVYKPVGHLELTVANSSTSSESMLSDDGCQEVSNFKALQPLKGSEATKQSPWWPKADDLSNGSADRYPHPLAKNNLYTAAG